MLRTRRDRAKDTAQRQEGVTDYVDLVDIALSRETSGGFACVLVANQFSDRDPIHLAVDRCLQLPVVDSRPHRALVQPKKARRIAEANRRTRIALRVD